MVGLAWTWLPTTINAQEQRHQFLSGGSAATKVSLAEANLALAARYAPIFYQGLGETPRFDYITNFDFDDDWQGDNNWQNAEDPRFPLAAWVYFSVCETTTHYFIHYAVFHPRDWKGGNRRGVVMSDLLRLGARYGRNYDPTGVVDDLVLAHENDLEGCLVVVAKARAGQSAGERVVFVESLAHNKFLRYRPGSGQSQDTIRLENQRPLLFIEPRGHGIEAYRGSQRQLRASVKGTVRYEYTGQPGVPGDGDPPPQLGYALVPIETTLWTRAQSGRNETYGEQFNYGTRHITVGGRRRGIWLGVLGSAFLGTHGGRNMARPPWGWFDRNERHRPLGEWYFDPAVTIKRHFQLGNSFSTSYTAHPLLRPAASRSQRD
ncbi:MAG: hypothetical protein SNJ62_04165 [Chloracidobacterium sp.]